MSDQAHDGKPLRIIIVGGGIGGLTCAIALRGEGRDITILEKSSLLREVGAGISLQPNASRIMQKWGHQDELMRNGGFIDTGFAIYSSDGQLFRKIPFAPQEDGGNRVLYHRIDIHNGLKELATSPEGRGPPAKLLLGKAVRECDCENGIVTLQDGTKYEADVVIAADGIHSAVRRHVIGKEIECRRTGLSAYRFSLTADEIKDVPELARTMDLSAPHTTMIVGHDRRIIFGPCRGGQILTAVALVPDEFMNEASSSDSWVAEGNLEEALKSFEVFPEWIKTMFKRASSLGLWQLRDIAPLDTWVKGRTILVGDAAHAMLPTQGQGASQTVEDAEALAHVFEGVTTSLGRDEVNKRLETVFKGRYDRASLIQAYSRAQVQPEGKSENPAANLNPMQFEKFNTSYVGFGEWLSRPMVAG